MSSWLAAPLAIVLMIAIGAAVLVVIWLIGWLIERIQWWLQGSRLEVILDNIGMILAVSLVVVVMVVSWYGIFVHLKGWA